MVDIKLQQWVRRRDRSRNKGYAMYEHEDADKHPQEGAEMQRCKGVEVQSIHHRMISVVVLSSELILSMAEFHG
jgi:hypothetical protein